MRPLHVLFFVALHGCLSAPGSLPTAERPDGAQARLGFTSQEIFGDPNHTFGRILLAGDFDGDGHGDMLAGSSDTPCAGGFDCGRLSVFPGSPTGLGAPTVVIEGTTELERVGDRAVVGDFDGDGDDDVVTKAALSVDLQQLSGGPTGLVPGGPDLTVHGASHLGWSMDAGDANGDGYDDLLVSDWYAEDLAGEAYLFLGGPTGLASTPAAVIRGEPGDRLGYEVAFVGDIDGDGLDDVALRLSDANLVRVHHGTASGLDPIWTTEIDGDVDGGRDLGKLASGGDVNGDGHADLLVGRPYAGAPYEGRVDLFLGGAAGLSSTPARSIYGSDCGGLSMYWPIGVGDLDLDGLDDVILKFDTVPQESAIAILHGNAATGLDLCSASEIVNEPVRFSEYGSKVATIDVDGDAQVTGKALFTDLREGKMTYPLLVAMERSPELHAAVERCASKPPEQPLPADDLEHVLAALHNTGALEACREFARSHSAKAIAALDDIPCETTREALRTVAEATTFRKH